MNSPNSLQPLAFIILLIVVAILLIVIDHELVIFVAIAIILASMLLVKGPFSKSMRGALFKSVALILLTGSAIIIGLSKGYESGDVDGEALKSSGRWIGVGAIALVMAGTLPAALHGRRGGAYGVIPAVETVNPLERANVTEFNLPHHMSMTREEMSQKMQMIPLGTIDRVAIMTHTTVAIGTVPPPPDRPDVFRFIIVPNVQDQDRFPMIPPFSQVANFEERFIHGSLLLLQKIFVGIRDTVTVCDDDNLRPPCLVKIPGLPQLIYRKNSVSLEFEYGLQMDDTSEKPIEELVFTIYLNRSNHVYIGMRASEKLNRLMRADWKSPQNIIDAIAGWADDADITVDGIMSRYPTQSRALGDL